jgi:predicted nucleic acid-binding protein
VILVDTSVWVDHFRRGNAVLEGLLNERKVLTHPLVIEELACGQMKDRKQKLDLLSKLPSAKVASHEEVMALIEANGLLGAGLGSVDAHLLASCRLTDAPLATLDAALQGAAKALGVEFRSSP